MNSLGASIPNPNNFLQTALLKSTYFSGNVVKYQSSSCFLQCC